MCIILLEPPYANSSWKEHAFILDVYVPNHPTGLSLHATGYKEHGAANGLVQSPRDPCRERMAGWIKQQEHHGEHKWNKLTILAINKMC